MSIEEQPSQPNQWQQLAARTHDIVTPGNAIDAVALVAAGISAPHFDTKWGIVVGLAAFSADAVDGPAARHSGTNSKLGAKVDATGDKVKVGYAIYHIWNNDQAPKPLLAVVAAQNVANAAITLADLMLNKPPQIEVTKEGKRSISAQVAGIGLNVIGKKVAETRPVLGRAMKFGGTALALTGTVKYGIPATKSYWQTFKTGTAKHGRVSHK